jgi:hypothetical protein
MNAFALLTAHAAKVPPVGDQTDASIKSLKLCPGDTDGPATREKKKLNGRELARDFPARR